MFEGKLDEGELEIGQVSALIRDILPAGEIVNNIWKEFVACKDKPFKKAIFTL
jgi:enoyl-[acyl-carrier protein] reductase II